MDLKRGTTLASMAAISLRNAQLFEDLRNSLRQAEAASRAKSDFLAHMSHELRTPLNAVIGYAELMIMEPAGALAPPYHAYLKAVRDSGRHLLRMMEALLDLSRIEKGELVLQRALVPIDGLIAEALAKVADHAGAADVHLRAEAAPRLPILRLDADRVRQALCELLINAIRHSPRGGAVTLGAAPDPVGGAVLFVRDHGAGIRADDVEILFQPFRPGQDPLLRSEGGVGLGLPLSRKLIELHGGELWLESQPGHGTTVFIRLPVSAMESERNRRNLTTEP